MIKATSFAGHKVGVFGLARSGLSAARSLSAGAAQVVAWDDKEASRLAAASSGILLDQWERWPWEEIKAVILSPGIPLTHPKPHAIVHKAKEYGAEIIGDLELFAREMKRAPKNPDLKSAGAAPIISITGTNGKSTTTALIGHILQACGFDAQIGGNIGKPALELNPPSAKTVYALEVSSYQADLSPGLVSDVALLTNLSPDHIDRHGSMENYAAVKAALLARTDRNGHIVIGVDDPHSAALYTRFAATDGAEAVAVSVGKVLGRGIFVIDGKLYDAWNGPATLAGDLNAAQHLPGAHNWQNAALAYASVRRLIRDPRAIVNAIVRFPGLAHRIEDVGRLGKVRFVNDSKATNADAAARALACYRDIFWIAGGKAKEGGIEDLAPFFPRIRKAYLIGDAAEMFGRTLAGKVEAAHMGTLDRALAAAAADAERSAAPEPVVLLSPACASFDQFKDFEDRGDQFRAMVQSLIEGAQAPQKGVAQ